MRTSYLLDSTCIACNRCYSSSVGPIPLTALETVAMVTIETDLGRFEGSTLKDAERVYKKAQREADKRSKIREGIQAVAFRRAQAGGFQILTHKIRHETADFPRGWAFTSADHADIRFYAEIGESKPGEDTPITIETQDGRGTFGVWRRSTFRGVVSNGSGFAIAVALREHGDKDELLYAVGTNEGEAQMARLYGIVSDDFRERRVVSSVAVAVESGEPVAVG